MAEREIEAQFGRVKGAEWFPLLHQKDILVLGQGGIGSWTSLLLSRIGANLHIYDMDSYEEHNMTGQVVGKSGIGENKALAMKKLIAELSPAASVETYQERYDEDQMTNDIVICGFDNMVARKVAFKKWKEHVNGLDEKGRKNCFFQDGRLLAEQLQIFNIAGDQPDKWEIYEKEHLFDDSAVEDAECTFKQTSHCAAMIAAHMVGFLTSWAVNSVSPMTIRPVPFYYEYFIPTNRTVLQ